VTTKKFLEAFRFGLLRDLPDLERLEDEGRLERERAEGELDSALGLADLWTDEIVSNTAELDDVEEY
jgi:hypothetical protein